MSEIIVPGAKENTDWLKDTVAIHVMLMPNDGEPPVISVGINGTMFDLPRGVDIEVPRAVADNLTEARHRAHEIVGGQGLRPITGWTQRFPWYPVQPSKSGARAPIKIMPRKPLAAEDRVQMLRSAVEVDAETRQAYQQADSRPHVDLR